MNSTSRRPLRAWQQAALDDYAAKGSPKDYLVTATPGAGKTTFALTFARRLLDARIVRRVTIIVPTDHLRSQWADAGAAMGITLDPTLDNSTRRVSADFDGYVATYAQVALKSALHRARTDEVATLVIFDEVHHAGDGLSWGDAVRDAFGSATRRLCLTGTPFRTSATERIPFVRYDDDGEALVSVSDYSYGYSDALADHVVRPVMFAAYSGVARWRDSAGDVFSASLSEQSTREMEQAAWKTVLSPTGQWVPHVIAAADARLTEVRGAGMPDAGAMMLASDQDAARAYAAIIERVTGHAPTVVLSDDPRASARIDEFSRGTDRWLVAVRMVSEGVDVPRLAVGVWATSYRTPLFFAQAVGRFVRARGKHETATVFLPAVRPLLALAAQLEQSRDHVLTKKAPEDDGLLDVIVDRPEPASDTLGYEALEAEAEFAHVLFGGAAHTGSSTPNLTDDEAEFLGLPGLLDPDMMAVVLKKREQELRASTRTREPSGDDMRDAITTHRQVSDLRKEISRLVSRYAASTATPHAQVHARVRARVPGPPTKNAPLPVLQDRRDFLLSLVS